MIEKRLYRSRTNRIFAGIFGGLGEYFGIDPVLLRVIYVVVLVITAFVPGVLIYLLAIFIIPLEPERGGPVVHEMPKEHTTESGAH